MKTTLSFLCVFIFVLTVVGQTMQLPQALKNKLSNHQALRDSKHNPANDNLFGKQFQQTIIEQENEPLVAPTKSIQQLKAGQKANLSAKPMKHLLGLGNDDSQNMIENNLSISIRNAAKRAAGIPQFKLDSSIFNGEQNYTSTEWTDSTKLIKQFDANGNQTLYSNYIWNDTINQLIGEDKYEDIYDLSGNWTNEIEYVWDRNNNDWIKSWKYEASYDANNNQIYYADYIWNSYKNDWVKNVKQVLNYNTQNDFTLIIYSKLDTISNTWANDFKYEYTHLSNGNRYERYTSAYNSQSNVWELSTLREYTTDASGNWTQYLDSKYDSNNLQWVKTTKTDMAYDQNKHIILNTIYSWNASTALWVGVTKNEVAYNDQNSRTLYVSCKWDTALSLWVGISKFVYTYNAQNKPTSYVQYKWNTTNNVWGNYVKWLKEYDAIGNLSSRIYYFYDMINNVWNNANNITKYIYTLNSLGKIATQVEVFSLNTYYADTEIVKTEFTYNDLGYLSQAVLYKKSSDNTWIIDYKIDYGYDENKYLVSTIYKTNKTVSKSWIGDNNKRINEYDGMGNQTKELSSTKEMPNSPWRINSTNVWGYDTNHNIISSANYGWRGGVWMQTAKNVFKFDEIKNTDDKIIQRIRYRLDTVTNVWSNSNRQKFSYLPNGKISKIETDGWNYVDWANQSTEMYAYNTLDQLIQYVYNDLTINTYSYSYKYEYSYNSSGQLASSIYVRETTATDSLGNDITKWVELDKAEYSYDSDGNLITFIEDSHKTTLGYQDAPLNSNTISPNGFFTINGMDVFRSCPTTAVGHNYINGNWVDNQSQKFYYSAYSLSGLKSVNQSQSFMYPNPVNDAFGIHLDAEYNNMELDIFTPLGQLISKKSYISKQLVYVGTFSKGIYFVRLSSGNNVLRSGKLVIE